MVHSMTGYGRAVQTLRGREITAELRSVNNRFLDCGVKLPRSFSYAEDAVKQTVKQSVSRGKVDVYISVAAAEDEAVNIRLNRPVLEGYLNALRTIAADYGVRDDVSATSLARMSDVFTVEKPAEDEEQNTQDILTVVRAALEAYNAMRATEGAALAADLRANAALILEYVGRVEQRSPITVQEYRARLEAKMREVLAGTTVDESRILTEAAIFADKVARIRKYMPVLALMGGLIAAGTSMSIMAGDPISLGLLAEGDRVNAGLTALARAIGFIPLVATTAITTGVYAPAGMTFVFVIGLLIPNPFIALIAGAACICVEILLLNVIAKGLDKFPGIKRCGDNIRTAMSYVIDIALLIGGILAAQAIMPTTGLFIIVAFWCINKCSKKPLVSMAVGPLGAILVGLIANVLFLLSLYTPAA